MGRSYELGFRAEILKERLAKVAGRAFWLKTKEGEELSFEAGVLANKLLNPEYDSSEALDDAEAKLNEFKTKYEKLKKGV